MSGRPFPNGIPNGVTGFPNGSAPSGQSFQPPPMPGQPRQPLPGNPRGSAGSGPPFPSPTMSHSPQSSVSGPHPSLGQSPHLGPRMAPPPSNGMQGPHGYPMNRPPSRTASPGNMAGMMHSRSPSMSARQPPMPPQDPLTMELMRVPPNQLTTLKDELGLSGKEITSMNMEEKVCLSLVHPYPLEAEFFSLLLLHYLYVNVSVCAFSATCPYLMADQGTKTRPFKRCSRPL